MALNKVPSLDKSGSSSKTEQKTQWNLILKKGSLPLASSDDKNMEEKKPTEMTIKKDKWARDDRSCSTMTVSLDGDHTPRKKKKKKLSETSITGNQINQYQ